jgi:hypothetical protein
MALAKEQLAAITEHGFHGMNFRLDFGWLWNDYWRHWIRCPGGLSSSWKRMNGRLCFGRVGSSCLCFNCSGVARLGLGLAIFLASHFGNNRLMVMGLVWLLV